MDIAIAKKRLQEKERELEGDIARRETAAREDVQPEVQDYTDMAVTTEDSEKQFRKADWDSRVLAQVREALARIENGTYGKCVDCGRPIEPSRLEAIPWTPYCLADQQRHDRLSGRTAGPTL